MTECNRCGDCCEAIGLPLSHADAAAITGNSRMDRWARDELEPLVGDAIYARLVPLAQAERDHPGYVTARWWYTCKNFDREARTCGVHDDKPNACRGFPWYDGEPHHMKLAAYPRCSFWADVEAAELHLEKGAE